ncbi:MAG: porin [Gallionella sp.]
MQKKIIALAVASALAIPAAAMAEVTVYGQMNMAYEVVDNGDDTTAPTPVGTTAPSRNTVSSNKSRLGFKGTEDLGNGMTVLWQMEGQVNGDDGTNKLFTRNTFVGLSSEYGTAVWGNHDTPYKMASGKTNVFKDTVADNRTIMGGGIHETRLSDVAAYISPDFNGFSFAAAYAGKTDNGLGATGSTVASATSISANYARDNYTVAVATQTIAQLDKITPGNEGDITATKLVGTYSMDAFTVGLVYEMLSNTVDATVAGRKTESDNVYLSAKYMVSDKGAVKLGYTTAGEGKTGGVTNKGAGASQVAIGYSHKLGDNTSVYALYTTVANDTAANYGIGKRGSSAGFATTANLDDDPNAIAIGMRMSF